MTRRLLAWVALIGFILLIINLIFFHYFISYSVFVYIAIVLAFLFTSKQGKK